MNLLTKVLLLASFSLVFTPTFAATKANNVAAKPKPIRVITSEDVLFMDAVERDRVDIVQSLLKAGYDPNIMVHDGDPALVRAIRLGNKEVLKELLACKRLNINLASSAGENALMLAAFSGNMPLVQTILAQRPQLNKTVGWTALHYAVYNKHTDIVKLLISKGARVNTQTENGTTALYLAAKNASRDIVLLLTRAGAYKDLCTERGDSPASAATAAGDKELADYLAIKACHLPRLPTYKKIPPVVKKTSE